MTSTILFQYFVGNILSFALTQIGNVLIRQKKALCRSIKSFPLHPSSVCGLMKKSSARHGGMPLKEEVFWDNIWVFYTWAALAGTMELDFTWKIKSSV